MSPRQKATKGSDKAEEKQTAPTKNTEAVDNNLEKVRELLFGAAIQDSNEKQQKLEENFATKLEKFQADVHTQFESLSRLIQDTAKEINVAIKSESDQRQEDIDDLLKKLAVVDQSIADLDTQTMLEQKQMSEQFENGLEQLKNEFDTLHKTAMSRLDASAKTLESNKTDREFLASLLNDLSSRLQKGE